MKCMTHVIGGAAFTSALCLHTGLLGSLELGPLAFGLIGSLFPDIDHPRSKIANTTLATKAASVAISSTVRHRGFCHSLTFVAALSIFLNRLLVPRLESITEEHILWFAAGMLSHLLLDSLNPRGIKWFWPFGKYRRIMKIKTGSTGEITLAIFLMAANIYTFLNLL